MFILERFIAATQLSLLNLLCSKLDTFIGIFDCSVGITRSHGIVMVVDTTQLIIHNLLDLWVCMLIPLETLEEMNLGKWTCNLVPNSLGRVSCSLIHVKVLIKVKGLVNNVYV